jgi:hypothetical protein
LTPSAAHEKALHEKTLTEQAKMTAVPTMGTTTYSNDFHDERNLMGKDLTFGQLEQLQKARTNLSAEQSYWAKYAGGLSTVKTNDIHGSMNVDPCMTKKKKKIFTPRAPPWATSDGIH